jgi:hypothetical protein
VLKRTKIALAGSLALLSAIVMTPELNGSIAVDSLSKSPSVVVDARKYGWSPAPQVSNRKFFKDLSLAKLEALDENTRLAFLSEDIVALYHTKSGEHGQRAMEVFFLKAKDGSLLSTKTFAVLPRKSMNDRRDSEARILPLYDGRFLVFANSTMTVFNGSLGVEKEKVLQSGTGDMWSVQSVGNGHEIFLRHEANFEVTYSWLSSDSLATNHEQPGYQDRDFSAKGLVNASDKAVFTLSGSGLRMITQNGEMKTICDDQLCRGDGAVAVLASRYVGISTRAGLGIVDTEAGLVWSKRVVPSGDPRLFQFGEIRSSTEGTGFAAWVAADKKSFFDGVAIADSPKLLVYDRSHTESAPATIPMNPASGDWDYSLSPNGTKLAIFDGARVRIYSLD